MIHAGFESKLRPQPDGSLSVEQLHTILRDLQDEPPWRRSAAREEDYYDSKQIDSATLRLMQENGIPPIVNNRIQPAIDSLAGFETIIRADFAVKAEDDASAEGAIALNAKLKEAQRLSDLDEEIALAYFDMIRIGIGWTETSRRASPFQYPYRVERLPWREMYFDWRARKADLSDSRYFMRRSWWDPDVLATFFPRHRDLIRYAANGWARRLDRRLRHRRHERRRRRVRTAQRRPVPVLVLPRRARVARHRTRPPRALRSPLSRPGSACAPCASPRAASSGSTPETASTPRPTGRASPSSKAPPRTGARRSSSDPTASWTSRSPATRPHGPPWSPTAKARPACPTDASGP